MDALVAVRSRIASAIVGEDADSTARLGMIDLRPHQTEAVRRLRHALHLHGGALLADAPGLGKTYVALALARAFGAAIVAAPAALRAQWLRSAATAGVPISWCSLETLSRRRAVHPAPLLIIDEAHHLRNPATRRYAHAAALAMGKHVLLLSATPVHNRRAERDALLALFLGAHAASLAAAELAEIIVRREADPRLLPRRRATRWLSAPRTSDIAAALRDLPPPLPAADGRAAVALIRLTLAHAWSSSLAALDATLRRSVHRAAAIDDALGTGRWPTRAELRAWVTSAESSQLAFPELLAAPATGDIAAARTTLAQHFRTLNALRARTAAARDHDTAARAHQLRRVMHAHPDATIVAFSRYADTVAALWTALRHDAGVVAITARGVRSAGNGLRRAELLAALGTEGHSNPRLPLRLVLSTDLLGEGLDLRAASVIVHLDQPWTPALADQREGRASRLLSPHAAISVYAFRPPAGADALLAMGERLETKRGIMAESTSAGSARESLLTLVQPWRITTRGGARVGAASANRNGWVAAVRDAWGRTRVIAAVEDGPVVEDDDVLCSLLQCAVPAVAAALDMTAQRSARRRIARWYRAESSARLAQARAGGATRVALIRRLDAAARAEPVHRRAALHARIRTVRRWIAVSRGAGIERELTAAARQPTVPTMLDALERLAHSPDGASTRTHRPRVLALLLLQNATGPQPAARATVRPTAPAAPRSAACSESAATR